MSLRNLAATIADVVGQAGRLAVSRRITGTVLAAAVAGGSKSAPIHLTAVAKVVSHDLLVRDYWGVPRQISPLRAVFDQDRKYIHRPGDVGEELFDLSDDVGEQRNLAGDQSAQTTLAPMRAAWTA